MSMQPKFAASDRCVANETAPMDYRGLRGTITQRGPYRAEYGVRFDGVDEVVYLKSWCLDKD